MNKHLFVDLGIVHSEDIKTSGRLVADLATGFGTTDNAIETKCIEVILWAMIPIICFCNALIFWNLLCAHRCTCIKLPTLYCNIAFGLLKMQKWQIIAWFTLHLQTMTLSFTS